MKKFTATEESFRKRAGISPVTRNPHNVVNISETGVSLDRLTSPV
ncbi:MAG: hypothetical protein ABII06_16485 [Pseudomonadota bacterium]